MNNDVIESYTGIIVDDGEPVSLIKLSHCCDLSVEEILTMVEYGVIEPLNFQTSHIRWEFNSSSIVRINIATRLQRDLEVNLAGAALALELLDEIKTLRST
jgi:chaperone modulatory protein CbpM